jgi:hypothetical protein
VPSRISEDSILQQSAISVYLPAAMVIAFSSEVEAGSREESALKQRSKARF